MGGERVWEVEGRVVTLNKVVREGLDICIKTQRRGGSEQRRYLGGEQGRQKDPQGQRWKPLWCVGGHRREGPRDHSQEERSGRWSPGDSRLGSRPSGVVVLRWEGSRGLWGGQSGHGTRI